MATWRDTNRRADLNLPKATGRTIQVVRAVSPSVQFVAEFPEGEHTGRQQRADTQVRPYQLRLCVDFCLPPSVPLVAELSRMPACPHPHILTFSRSHVPTFPRYHVPTFPLSPSVQFVKFVAELPKADTQRADTEVRPYSNLNRQTAMA